VFDYASQFLMSRPVIGISAVAQLRSVLPAFAVDTLLAPLGLLVSFTTYAQLEALVLVLPVLLLFARFARERQHRIDNALELSTAYRGTAMLLGDVIEPDDEYIGTHSRDVVDLVLAAAARLRTLPARPPARGVRCAVARCGQGEGLVRDHQQDRPARRAGVGDHEDAHGRRRTDAGTDRRSAR
jgi:hypothetical protein